MISRSSPQRLLESDLPVDTVLAGIQDPVVKQQLIDNTNAAVERGVFGSPSFFVGDELYFGKDKLQEVEDEIGRQTAISVAYPAPPAPSARRGLHLQSSVISEPRLSPPSGKTVLYASCLFSSTRRDSERI